MKRQLKAKFYIQSFVFSLALGVIFTGLTYFVQTKSEMLHYRTDCLLCDVVGGVTKAVQHGWPLPYAISDVQVTKNIANPTNTQRFYGVDEVRYAELLLDILLWTGVVFAVCAVVGSTRKEKSV